jgi:hypothetical protein
MVSRIQHWSFLFLAIANFNRQNPIGELLIFRNVGQVMILRSFVCLVHFHRGLMAGVLSIVFSEFEWNS